MSMELISLIDSKISKIIQILHKIGFISYLSFYTNEKNRRISNFAFIKIGI